VELPGLDSLAYGEPVVQVVPINLVNGAVGGGADVALAVEVKVKGIDKLGGKVPGNGLELTAGRGVALHVGCNTVDEEGEGGGGGGVAAQVEEQDGNHVLHHVVGIFVAVGAAAGVADGIFCLDLGHVGAGGLAEGVFDELGVVVINEGQGPNKEEDDSTGTVT
jgi:hypothetical protein